MAQPGERYYLSETIVDNIRHRMGWCPHGVPRKTRSLTGPEPFLPVQASVPFGPAAPDPSVTVPAENRLEYQTNLLLVLVFLAGLFYATTPDFIVPFLPPERGPRVFHCGKYPCRQEI